MRRRRSSRTAAECFHGYNAVNLRSGSDLVSITLTFKLTNMRMQDAGSAGAKLTLLVSAAGGPRRRLMQRRAPLSLESTCRGTEMYSEALEISVPAAPGHVRRVSAARDAGWEHGASVDLSAPRLHGAFCTGDFIGKTR